MMREADWTISGADGQPIIGTSHLPEAQPRGVIIIAHGFKGYKDYGMFPRIAQQCAEAGLLAHRFNFSHSGMTNTVETFERPELFERDTWNKQVFDLRAVMQAVQQGELDGQGLPMILFGHSRGGVTALLTAGRGADDEMLPQPTGVITAAAPDTCNSLSEADAAKLLRDGFLDSPSSRTGQTLRIGRAFVQEQLDDPAGHDVLGLVMRVKCPLLIIHGEGDATVPPGAARRLAEAAGNNAQLHLLPGGDHVFNTPNPLPEQARSSEQLDVLVRLVLDFAIRAVGAARSA